MSTWPFRIVVRSGRRIEPTRASGGFSRRGPCGTTFRGLSGMLLLFVRYLVEVLVGDVLVPAQGVRVGHVGVQLDRPLLGRRIRKGEMKCARMTSARAWSRRVKQKTATTPHGRRPNNERVFPK